MRNHTILPACLFISSILCCVPCRAQYCSLPPEELIDGQHQEYRGTYENVAYRYSVVIPTGLVGYDGIDPFYCDVTGLN
jgi:hypothetical protein